MSFSNREWTNICPLEQGKKYKISFVPSELSSVEMHIHDENGNHLSNLGIAGASMLANFNYQYVINCHTDGYLSMRVPVGSIDGLTCEEVSYEIFA